MQREQKLVKTGGYYFLRKAIRVEGTIDLFINFFNMGNINKAAWATETGKIFNGMVLYAIAGAVYGILDPINSMASLASTLGVASGLGFLDVLCWIFLAGIIVAYILIFKGLAGFKTILAPADGNAIGKVRTSYILLLVAAAVDFIPLLGWVSSILYIIGFIMMLGAYSKLKNSATFPTDARSGASLLFISLILLVVGAVLGFIPLIGGWFNMVFSIIAYILTFLGWNKIKNASVE
ncbi:hypothetical protein AGMMS49525_08050 [Bacteroidia bacterium]|nr:hypothetical protein AGMMS49525_08050 [Bacteroidia bacterium]